MTHLFVCFLSQLINFLTKMKVLLGVSFWIVEWESVYLKCYFNFLINWNTKLDIKFWFLLLYWSWATKHQIKCFFDLKKMNIEIEILNSFFNFNFNFKNEKANPLKQTSYETTIIHKISQTNSNFRVTQRTTRKV